MREPVFEATECEGWDEEDWERFLQLADARTAKYEELFETFIDHPMREEIIAHEMGWEDFFRECRSRVDNCDECADRHECEAYEMLRLMEGPDNIEDDPDAEALVACFEEVKEIPAYTEAYEFALRLEEHFRTHLDDNVEDESPRTALMAATMAPAQIAGGHGIGYDRESLCGNIANCKRALKNLEVCMTSLADLNGRGLLEPEASERLHQESRDVWKAISRWIEDLRARVWWR
jgi:hypothetical protein